MPSRLLATLAKALVAREKYEGTENSMREAHDNIAEKVIAAYESIQNSQNSEDTESTPAYSQPQPNPQPQSNYQPQPYQTNNVSNDKRALAEARENLESGRRIKKAGYAMLGIGGGLFLLGGILFGVGVNSSSSEYGEDYYYEEEGDYGLIAGGIAMFTIGSAAIVTGASMAPVGAVREKKARIYLNSLSVAPTKGGAYAQVGFNF